jgi:hypothetical protein
MGRNKTASAPEQPAIDAQAISADLKKADERTNQLAVIDKRFGSVGPYDRNRMIEEAKFFIKQAGDSALEAGKRLILLKEHEGHGNFLPALDAIGIGARTAQNLMLLALKFSNTQALAHLGQAKLLELAVLDDSQIEALDKGGTVADLQLDEIDSMGYRELRTKLRDALTENQDLTELVAKKDEKLNKLDRALKKVPEIVPFSDETRELHKMILEHGVGMEDTIAQFHQCFDDLVSKINALDPADSEQESVAFSTVNAIERSVHRMRDLQEQVYKQFEGFIARRYNAIKAEQGE